MGPVLAAGGSGVTTIKEGGQLKNYLVYAAMLILALLFGPGCRHAEFREAKFTVGAEPKFAGPDLKPSSLGASASLSVTWGPAKG